MSRLPEISLGLLVSEDPTARYGDEPEYLRIWFVDGSHAELQTDRIKDVNDEGDFVTITQGEGIHVIPKHQIRYMRFSEAGHAVKAREAKENPK